MIRAFADLEAVSRAAAAHVRATAQRAVEERGRFDLALSGGSTPRRLLQLLAAAGPAALPWAHTHLWWCDERAVPPDHPDSNFGMARRALGPLAELGLDEHHLHRLRGEDADLPAAAETYQRELCAAVGEPPRLDLALLGLGSDAHTASLFPGSPALTSSAWVAANPVDSPLAGGSVWRLTLTAATLCMARGALMMVAGADKAAAVRAVRRGPRDPARYPAQLLAAAPQPVQWFIDEAAASQLDPGDLA